MARKVNMTWHEWVALLSDSQGRASGAVAVPRMHRSALSFFYRDRSPWTIRPARSALTSALWQLPDWSLRQPPIARRCLPQPIFRPYRLTIPNAHDSLLPIDNEKRTLCSTLRMVNAVARRPTRFCSGYESTAVGAAQRAMASHQPVSTNGTLVSMKTEPKAFVPEP